MSAKKHNFSPKCLSFLPFPTSGDCVNYFLICMLYSCGVFDWFHAALLSSHAPRLEIRQGLGWKVNKILHVLFHDCILDWFNNSTGWKWIKCRWRPSVSLFATNVMYTHKKNLRKLERRGAVDYSHWNVRIVNIRDVLSVWNIQQSLNDCLTK